MTPIERIAIQALKQIKALDLGAFESKIALRAIRIAQEALIKIEQVRKEK